MTSTNERHAGGLSPAWLLHRRPLDLLLHRLSGLEKLDDGRFAAVVEADDDDALRRAAAAARHTKQLLEQAHCAHQRVLPRRTHSHR